MCDSRDEIKYGNNGLRLQRNFVTFPEKSNGVRKSFEPKVEIMINDNRSFIQQIFKGKFMKFTPTPP